MVTAFVLSRDMINAEYGLLTELRPSTNRTINHAVIQAHVDRGTLWTLVDGPCGSLLTSGYHHVNRLAYYRSEKPVPAGVIVDEAPDPALVPCDDCCTSWDSDLYDKCPYCEDEKLFPHGHVGA